MRPLLLALVMLWGGPKLDGPILMVDCAMPTTSTIHCACTDFAISLDAHLKRQVAHCITKRGN